MKILRWILGLLLLALFSIFLVSQVKHSFTVEHNLVLESTLAKAYPYTSSHLWKRSLFRDIKPSSQITPFQEGNVSTFIYGSKNKHMIESIQIVDSVSFIVFTHDFGEWETKMHFNFTEKFNTTDLKIKEEVKVKSILLRPIMMMNKASFVKQRESFF